MEFAILQDINSFVSDILEIDNLWSFTSLTKLQLDNNIIEEIKGLDCLTNLIWLGKFYSNPYRILNY